MSVATLNKAASVAATSPDASKAWVNGINAALGAAAKPSEGRPMLASVQITSTGDRLKFVTTNSYRANRVELVLFDSLPEFTIVTDAGGLKAALPKPSVFKTNGVDRLQIGWFPGARELDSGQLHICWGNEQRIVRADPDGGGAGSYPNVENLIDGALEKREVTIESVCYNPTFLSDIAKEAKLINKDRFVKVTPGGTPLQPAMFTTNNTDEGVFYESLLMPVRES